MSGRIRQATASDVTAMHRVRMSVQENRLVSRVLSEADYVAAIGRTGRGWVAEQEGTVVAFAVGNGEDGNIWALFVEPACEGQGLGRQLHDAMVDWLWERGHNKLWLTTEPGTRAERFYLAAGWRQVGAVSGGEVRLELARSMRSAIREEVASIDPVDELERVHCEDALAWIDSGAELCRVQKPATPPKHLVSYFVLVDHDQVLLVDHRNARLWLPSGGHVEPGEHPRATVSRELREELGLELADAPAAPLMLTSTATVGATAGHTDVSLWYVIDADRSVPLRFDAEEFHCVRWFHFSEAPLSRSDPHLARFLGKLALTSHATRPRAKTRLAT